MPEKLKLASPHGLCPRCGAGLHRVNYGYRPEARPRRWDLEAGCCIGPEARQLACEACGQGLGRLMVKSPMDGLIAGPDPIGYDARPWPSWSAFQWAALRSLQLEERDLAGRVLDLAVPQHSCCFNFGTQKRPLPIGALLRLWRRDKAARPRCPKCGGPSRAYGFGGLLSVGGYSCLCLHCGQGHLAWLGGIGRVLDQVRPHLEGTPWYLNGARFGGAFGADGAELGRALELGAWLGPEGAAEVSMRAGGHPLPPLDADIKE